MEKVIIKTATCTLIGSLIDDDVNAILEDQNNQIMEFNKNIGIASRVELF